MFSTKIIRQVKTSMTELACPFEWILYRNNTNRTFMDVNYTVLKKSITYKNYYENHVIVIIATKINQRIQSCTRPKSTVHKNWKYIINVEWTEKTNLGMSLHIHLYKCFPMGLCNIYVFWSSEYNICLRVFKELSGFDGPNFAQDKPFQNQTRVYVFT